MHSILIKLFWCLHREICLVVYLRAIVGVNILYFCIELVKKFDFRDKMKCLSFWNRVNYTKCLSFEIKFCWCDKCPDLTNILLIRVCAVRLCRYQGTVAAAVGCSQAQRRGPFDLRKAKARTRCGPEKFVLDIVVYYSIFYLFVVNIILLWSN